ncbi:MAG: hypothetical protein WBH68_02290 [Erysipelotrichaceae bacterium]|jgi:hypothetical protein|nr:hypothetical protein [Bacillota bacterium]NLP21981.1 hypothetical protein [Erysipelotrichaceae bacterium]HCY05980.1 hypothetical protein [Erysipelotrichaceae bacterium]
MKTKITYFLISLSTYILLFVVEALIFSFFYTLLNINFLYYPITYLILLIIINPRLTYRVVEYIIDNKWISL